MRGSVLFVTFLFFVLSPLLAKKKPRTGKEALFGKEYATYQITSNELSGNLHGRSYSLESGGSFEATL